MREPLEEDEFVALHFLDLNGLVLFVKKLFPHALAVADERLLRGLLVHWELHLRELGPMVEISVHIVVAGDEKLLDMAAVGALVVREHLIPDVCDALHFLDKPRKAEVTGDNHAVHLLCVKPLERLAEVRTLLDCRHMDVAQDAEPEPARTFSSESLERLRRRGKCAGKRHASKRTSRNHDALLTECPFRE